MRPRSAVLRISPAVGANRRPRSLGIAAAIGLLAVIASPVQGGRPATGAGVAGDRAVPGRSGPAVEMPVRPTRDPSPTLAAPPPGTSSLVSLDRAGGRANAASAQASISASGRYIAFVSIASDLVRGDTNQAVDVFVRDRRNPAKTIRLPLPGGGFVPKGGSALDPSISADGSVVAFVYQPPVSTTAVLAAPSQPVVLAWVRATGETEIVSIAPSGGIARPSTEPSVSGNGRLIAFTSLLSTAAGVPGVANVYVRDRAAGTTMLVSERDSEPAGAATSAPAISRDGRFVAFQSDDDGLAPGDDNGETDVLVRELRFDPIELVSVAIDGQANGPSTAPAISGDGGRIAFESGASNLVTGPASAGGLVYVRDRSGGLTFVASVGNGGVAAGAGGNGQASISDDGRIVAWASSAAIVTAAAGHPGSASAGGPAAGPVNADLAAFVAPRTEVYARDLETGETILVSEARGGGPAGGQNLGPSIGGNGRYVAFSSTSPNLVRGDDNKVGDVFLRDLPPAPALNPATLDFGTRALGADGAPLAAILTNGGWGPLTGRASTPTGAAAADFTVVLDGCNGVVLHRNESCPVTVSFGPTAPGNRAATLEVAHDGPRAPASARLRGAGSRAELKIDPPLGHPGIVVIATGAGFPPNAPVGLSWSRGLTPKMPAVTTDADGGFRVQVLVFHNDVIGARDLVARPLEGATFPELSAAFLVVEASSQPPRFIVQDPFGDRNPSLVMRR
ncbi:MAG TPA: choice-of-anchor D domain-containing protein [Candidatus Limnocylindrales bacterium]|nr:choice-of-anchor D domain-containing protein [Candidatus Limnocylindrales bacterium]